MHKEIKRLHEIFESDNWFRQRRYKYAAIEYDLNFRYILHPRDEFSYIS